MTQLSGKERADYVQNLFTRIAARYDLMNRLMTAGQDVRWRRQVIRLACLTPGARMLDLGAGTGDLAREALSQQPGVNVTAADFTLEMMRVGKKYGPLPWSAAAAGLRDSLTFARHFWQNAPVSERRSRCPLETVLASALLLYKINLSVVFCTAFLLRY
jgi:cyclopropane fatty-acyl-phospholipid synthase-like methyltransferase